MVMQPDEIITTLGLVPLGQEGGLWSQLLLDEHSSAIYYLLVAGDFSALHKLPGPEIYHHYMGAALQLLLLFPDGSKSEQILGTDLAFGQRPAVVVPGNVWQGSRSLGDWSLVGTTMSPAFSNDDFELGNFSSLARDYPSFSSSIRGLTRD